MSSLVFRTIQPEASNLPYKRPPYREIVGITSNSAELWIPSADISATEAETWEFPDELADNIVGYFGRHHVESRSLYRNCHVGAAIMSSGNVVDMDDAEEAATQLIKKDNIATENLPLGTWGVLGIELHGEEPLAMHSVLGLGEDKDVCLQVDKVFGPLSIASYANILEHYLYGNPSIKFYTQAS